MYKLKTIRFLPNFIFLLLFFLPPFKTLLAAKDFFLEKTPYQICFTPQDNCTQLIIDSILSATHSIYIQAYSFTSSSIAKALLHAKRKGVFIKVILDKSQIKNNRYSIAKLLLNQKIPTWIDHKPSIAHNKVIIIDNYIIITGSFNFTKAAQEKNAENLLIVYDKTLANYYLKNWYQRLNKSSTAYDYLNK